MGVNRSTANTETLSDITLTVSPNTFETSNGYEVETVGAVGVNTPNPTDGTFEISDVAVKTLGSGVTVGSFDTTKWQFFNNNVDNSQQFGIPQFYREGSRVYMDGLIRLKAGQTYALNASPPILTLPLGWRPVKNIALPVALIQTRSIHPPLEEFTMGTVYIYDNGELRLISMTGNVSGDQSNATIGSDGFSGTGTLDGNQLNWISLSNINFRCTD